MFPPAELKRPCVAITRQIGARRGMRDRHHNAIPARHRRNAPVANRYPGRAQSRIGRDRRKACAHGHTNGSADQMSNSSKFGRIWVEFVAHRTQSKSPTLADLGRIWSNIGPNPGTCGGIRDNFGQRGANLSAIGPSSVGIVNTWSTLANVREMRAKSDRIDRAQHDFASEMATKQKRIQMSACTGTTQAVLVEHTPHLVDPEGCLSKSRCHRLFLL